MIELLKDRYDIKRKIGSGGMAQIYLAYDKIMKRKVAIKLLEANDKNDITRKKRFQHEMRLLQKINSPYVVKFFGGELSEDSHNSYIAMEYVDGYILKNYVRNRTRLTVDESVEFSKQMTLGFDEIHKEGIVHRDIKSQNIMVTDSGQVKILDFGIAIDEDSESLTKTNMLIASPQYVAPELIRQESPSPQSDIYALGVMIYEMLTGKVPLSGKDTIDTLRMHQNIKMPRITQKFANVPQSVENIILKATAKNRDDRYKSMFDMYLDLKTCLAPERMSEQLIWPDSRPTKRSLMELINSKLMIWILTGALITTVIVLTIVLVVMFV